MPKRRHNSAYNGDETTMMMILMEEEETWKKLSSYFYQLHTRLENWVACAHSMSGIPLRRSVLKETKKQIFRSAPNSLKNLEFYFHFIAAFAARTIIPSRCGSPTLSQGRTKSMKNYNFLKVVLALWWFIFGYGTELRRVEWNFWIFFVLYVFLCCSRIVSAAAESFASWSVVCYSNEARSNFQDSWRTRVIAIGDTLRATLKLETTRQMRTNYPSTLRSSTYVHIIHSIFYDWCFCTPSFVWDASRHSRLSSS